MRTNIVLNDDLVREAMKYAQARSKTALVEEALRTFVEIKARELRMQTYAQRTLLLEAKLTGLELRERPSKLLRDDRNNCSH